MTDETGFADWRAIWELKARYCRLLDTKQWDEWGQLFTEDYVMDVTVQSDLPLVKGRQAVVDFVSAQLVGAETAHHVHSPEIQVDGDRAHVVWAMQDRVVNSRTGLSITGFGHYHEQLLRRDGRWQIAAMRLSRLHLDVGTTIRE